MKLSEQRMTVYAKHVASRTPVPGGGSVAAVCALLGCSLVEMVANFTIGKEQYRDVSSLMRRARRASRASARVFTRLIDADARAYLAYTRARAARRGTPATRAQALRRAIDVPLLLCRTAAVALDEAVIVGTRGNRFLVNDAAAAAGLFAEAFAAGRLNVETNIRGFSDRRYARRVSAELRRLERVVRARVATVKARAK